MGSTHLLDDLPLDDINDEHGILPASHNDLGGAFGREAHALQVLHILMSAVPVSTWDPLAAHLPQGHFRYSYRIFHKAGPLLDAM